MGIPRTFLEDWFFTTGEAATGGIYYPAHHSPGTTLTQVVASGPDADFKAIRETYVAAILRARERVVRQPVLCAGCRLE